MIFYHQAQQKSNNQLHRLQRYSKKMKPIQQPKPWADAHQCLIPASGLTLWKGGYKHLLLPETARLGTPGCAHVTLQASCWTRYLRPPVLALQAKGAGNGKHWCQFACRQGPTSKTDGDQVAKFLLDLLQHSNKN